MTQTILEALDAYFMACPLMSDGRLNIDYLPESTKQAGVEYSISTEPTDEVVTRYRDGGAMCRYVFSISSVNDYGPDKLQNIANSGFYETLAAWLRVQNKARNFPTLPAGMQPLGIGAIGMGFLVIPDVDAGKYQIQCELKYYRKGE